MTVEEMATAVGRECRKYIRCKVCPLQMAHIDCTRIDADDCSEDEARAIYNVMFPQADCTKSNQDSVNHPSHYNQGGIECLDAMIAAYGKDAVKDFCVLNAFKYLWRYKHKNGESDLDKAIWYLTKRKELSDE